MRKQPSSLEALRQNSRPLQAEAANDYKYAAYTSNANSGYSQHQTLFSRNEMGGQGEINND